MTKKKTKRSKNSPPKRKVNKIKLSIRHKISENNKGNKNLDLSENKKILNKNGNEFLKNNKENKTIMVYNENEINILKYIEAIKYDKRTYCQYYISLLKTKHIIIFTFFNSNDYNSMLIKINLLLFSFSLNVTINALFFTGSTLHVIKLQKGEFNFIYQLPQIIYSTLIISIVNLIMKYFSLSEKNIIDFKNEESYYILNKKMEELINFLKIKFILFYIISFIFLIFFWYYLSCFCAVYKNTQVHLIKNTIISFGLSLIYPLGLYLIPGIFRILSIKKQNKFMFNFSRILGFLL